MSSHANSICSLASLALRIVGRVRKYLYQTRTERLIHSFISSRLDYCNSLLYGLPAKENKDQRTYHPCPTVFTLATSGAEDNFQTSSLHLCTYQCKAGGGGGDVRQGMGWGFDTFQKCAVKFPAHGHIIPVKCNQISPTRAAHCCQISQGRTQEVLTIIRVTLRRIQKPLREIPHFVSLIIPFLVKGTKKVSFISLQ